MKTCLATFLAACAAFSPCKSPGQENLVQNGSFELNNSYSYWTLAPNGGLLNLAGPGAGVQCADGYNAVGLHAGSTVYQDISTVVGQKYDFRFYMADWGPSYVGGAVELIPSFGNLTLGTDSFDGTGKSYQNMGWEKFDYTVIADSTTSRLSFYNPSVDPWWAMIDDVWVTPVPEPTALTVLATGIITICFCRLWRRQEWRQERIAK